MSVKTLPATRYLVDEKLNLKDLVVTLTYTGGLEGDFTEEVDRNQFGSKGITASPIDGAKLTASNTQVTLTHANSGKTVSFPIQVSPNTSSVKLGDKTLSFANPYLKNDGTYGTSSDYTAYYDVVTKTLQLKGYNRGGSQNHHIHAATGDLTIALTGTNTISQGGIRADGGKITITGSGSLSLNKASIWAKEDILIDTNILNIFYTSTKNYDIEGIRSESGNITIKGATKLTLDLKTGLSIYGIYAASTGKQVSIGESAQVSILVEDASLVARGISATTNISGNAKVVIDLKDIGSYPTGIYGATTINENTEVRIQCKGGSSSTGISGKTNIIGNSDVTIIVEVEGDTSFANGILGDTTISTKDKLVIETSYKAMNTLPTITDPNKYIITGAYNQQNVTYQYAGAVTGMSMKTEPTTTRYLTGNNLDVTGLVVTLTYDSGLSEDVPYDKFAGKGITVSPAHGTALSMGYRKVTLTHTGGAVNFDIEVSSNTASLELYGKALNFVNPYLKNNGTYGTSSDYTAYYNIDTNTLYLNGYFRTSNDQDHIPTTTGDLKIVLKGSNVITGNIRSAENITITGEGSLLFGGGFILAGKDILIDASKVEIVDKGAQKDKKYIIQSESGNVTVKDTKLSLDITMAGDIRGISISSGNNVEIGGTADVTIKTSTKNGVSYGINGGNNGMITIKDNAKVTITDTSTTDDGQNHRYCGINGKTTILTKGELKISTTKPGNLASALSSEPNYFVHHYTVEGDWKSKEVTCTYNDIISSLDFTWDSDFDIPWGEINTPIDPVDLSTGIHGGTPPYTFNVISNLPSWLTLSPDGLITGKRPNTTSPKTTARIKVSDSAGDSKEFSLYIGAVSTESILLGGVTLSSEHPYLKNDGSYGSKDDYNAYYNTLTSELELKDYDRSGNIEAGKDNITILPQGNNVVRGNIKTQGNLTFGSENPIGRLAGEALKIDGGTITSDGNITIQNVKLELNADIKKNGQSSVKAKGNIKILGDSDVKITLVVFLMGETTTSTIMHSEGDIEISGNARCDIEALHDRTTSASTISGMDSVNGKTSISTKNYVRVFVNTTLYFYKPITSPEPTVEKNDYSIYYYESYPNRESTYTYKNRSKVTATSGDTNTGTVSASSDYAPPGHTVYLKATAKPGYKLKEWQVVNGSGITVTRLPYGSGDVEYASITMPATLGEVEVKAVFVQGYDIELVKGGGISTSYTSEARVETSSTPVTFAASGAL